MTGIEKMHVLLERRCGGTVDAIDVGDILRELGNLVRVVGNDDRSDYYVRIKLDIIQDVLIKNGHSSDPTDMFKTLTAIFDVFFDEVYQEYIEFAHDDIVRRFGPINEEEVDWRREQ